MKQNNHTNTVIDYLKVTINALLFLHSDWLSVMNRQTLRELSGVVVASLTGSTPELSPTSTSWPWSSMSDPTVSSPACWWYYSSSTGWTSGSSPRRSTWWSGPTARGTTTWWRSFSWKPQADTIIQSMRYVNYFLKIRLWKQHLECMKSFDKVVTELSLQQSNELFFIYCQLTDLSLHLIFVYFCKVPYLQSCVRRITSCRKT